MAVLGANGAELIVMQSKMFSEYGMRRQKYLAGPKGSPKKYFRWAARMVYWIWFWKIHSGDLGFLTPEEELAAKEEEEAAAAAAENVME
eukprot:SAG31_NODE_4451_length_3220_cov_5.866709_4_plen_89_part_00